MTPADPLPPGGDLLPLKKAAQALGMTYTVLLRLVNEGAVPAVNMNEHRGSQRPRYLVDPALVRKHLAMVSERQSVSRRAPPSSIDIRRIAQPDRATTA